MGRGVRKRCSYVCVQQERERERWRWTKQTKRDKQSPQQQHTSSSSSFTVLLYCTPSFVGPFSRLIQSRGCFFLFQSAVRCPQYI